MKKILLKATSPLFVAMVATVIALTGCEKPPKGTDDNGVIAVKSVKIDNPDPTIEVGGKTTLTTTVLPENAANKNVAWSIENSQIATIDTKTGEVTGIAIGSTIVTAITADGGHKATCTVTVYYLQPTITMTTARKEGVSFYLTGDGDATIDWGDGSELEKVPLSSDLLHVNHNYSYTPPRTIVIDGLVSYLNCNQNQLTTLDVSGCTAMMELYCYTNKLTTLDVSGCTALTRLDCNGNQLTSLDVSGCTALTRLDCNGNQLTTLDVSQNTALTSLDCNSNKLTTLALNALFGTLHSNTMQGGKTIYIKDNPGTDLCDQSIALTKGWWVDTTYLL